MFNLKKKITTESVDGSNESGYLQGLNNLLQISAISTNESRTMEEAFRLVLDAVCLFMDWPIGHVYFVDKENFLYPSDLWHIKDRQKFSNFYEVTMKTSFIIGEGLPGRIFGLGKPVWIKDITKDSNFLRLKDGEESGLKTAFGLPVIIDNKVRAVMEFFNETAIEPDYYFLGAVNQAGAQLGRVIEKKLLNEELNRRVKELEVINEDAKRTSKVVFNIFDDFLTIQRMLKDEKNKLKIVLESIGDGAFSTDDLGRIVFFNKVAEKISGYKAEEVIGKHYSSSLHFIFEKNHSDNYKFIEKVLNKGIISRITDHTILINKTGREIPVENSAAPIKNIQGEIGGCVVVFRDVTHEREVDKAKTEFVSLASHQLRTPLSIINWYAEMLLSGDAGQVNENQKKYLEEAYKASKRMVELVNALLNVSRLELGTFVVEPKPTDIVEVAKVCAKELKLQISEKKLVLQEKYDPDIPSISADPKLLTIVFGNLLSNAVKYTPDGGSIKLSISKANGQLSIVIEDTGYGIPKNQQDKIFSKLFRADNVREQDTEGTGLGLYIVKAIIDHSGGKISFESEENKGTTFYVSFPLEGMKKKEGTKVLG